MVTELGYWIAFPQITCLN